MEFRNFDKEKVWRMLIELLAEQEGAEIEYTIEKMDQSSRNKVSVCQEF